MEHKHRIILRQHWSHIRVNLEPDNILPKLVTVLTATDEGEIKAQFTRQQRCDKLLEILPRRGPTAFKVFVEALEEEAPHIGHVLIEAGNKQDPNQSSPLGDRSIHYVTQGRVEFPAKCNSS